MSSRLALILTAGALLSACSAPETPDAAAPRPTSSAPAPAPAPTTAGTATASDDSADTDAVGAGPARIRIVVAGTVLSATLRDTAAVSDLLAQLPVTLSMRDHGGVEETGRLPHPLRIDGEPDGADPDPGDLGYYAPGGDLVLYHGDQTSFPGIVILGSLEGDLDALARTAGEVEVEVGLLD